MEADQVLASVARKMSEDFESVTSQVRHGASKGRLREAVVNEYLNDWMPKSVRVEQSGEAVSTAGATSPELDVLLLDTETPPLVDERNYRVVPIECLHGVVQVKSRLDRQALREDAAVLTQVKRMAKTAFHPQGGPITRSTTLYGKEWPHFPTWGCIFGFKGASLQALHDELLHHEASTPVEQRVDAIFTLDQGAIVPLDDEGKITAFATANGERLALKSENPLLLMTVLMQSMCQQAWMPRFRLLDYLRHTEFGRPVSQLWRRSQRP